MGQPEAKVSSYSFLVLQPPIIGDSLRVYWDEGMREERRAECKGRANGMPQDGDSHWIGLWNRTGMASYYEALIDYAVGIDVSVALPPDPPYLVFLGYTCGFEDFWVTLPTENWQRIRENKNQTRDVETSPNRVAERNMTSLSVRIPAGATIGQAKLRIAGNFHFIEGGPSPLHAAERDGGKFGEAFFRQPTGQLVRRIYHTPFDSGWDQIRGNTAMPGEYTMEVRLTAPFLEDTVWTFDYISVWVFTPRIQEFGFVRPFAVYWTP